MANRKTKLNIMTPEAQRANITGVLNTGVKNSIGNDIVLNDLADVTISDAQTNDIMFFNGIQWVNKPIDETLLSYIWVLDGGDADGHDEPEPGPEPEPGKDTYAEKLTVVLYDLINGDPFQSWVNGTKGLDGMNMTGNTINLTVSGKFEGLYDIFYDDDNVNSMIGRMVSTIYDNMSKTIRYSLDDIATDVWLGWENFKDENTNEGEFKTKFFIYFSDSSIVFYDINVTYIK